LNLETAKQTKNDVDGLLTILRIRGLDGMNRGWDPRGRDFGAFATNSGLYG
jgi:hypothetical protein